MSNSRAGGSCFGLLIFIALIAALCAAWFWSHGMEPQQAMSEGFEGAAKALLVLGIVVVVAVTSVIALVVSFLRKNF